MKNFYFGTALAVFIFFAPYLVAEECAKVTLYFNERPPYLIPSADRNKVSGLKADSAVKAFEKAGIDFEWVATTTS